MNIIGENNTLYVICIMQVIDAEKLNELLLWLLFSFFFQFNYTLFLFLFLRKNNATHFKILRHIVVKIPRYNNIAFVYL